MTLDDEFWPASQLHSFYKSSQLLILTGDELSRDPGLPTAVELVELLNGECLAVALPGSNDLLQPVLPDLIKCCRMLLAEDAATVFERCGLAGDELDLASLLYDGASLLDLNISSLHRQLAAMTEARVATTALDCLLEIARCSPPFRTDRSEAETVAAISQVRGRDVQHLFGWIDPDGSYENVVLEPELPRKPAEEMLRLEEAVQQAIRGSKGVVLLGFRADSPLFRWVLRQLDRHPDLVRVAIVEEPQQPAAGWCLDRLLMAYNVHKVGIDSIVEAEPVLRTIRYGSSKEGEPPPWINDSLDWLAGHLPVDLVFGEWQGLARISLEQLITQINLLLPVGAREVLQASFLIPLRRNSEQPRLHIVSRSNPGNTDEPVAGSIDRFVLNIEAGREQGISGMAFCRGLALDSSDEAATEGPERNFSKEKQAEWLGQKGYREWRSILSIPILDSVHWMPVAVLALTSTRGKPFWSKLSQEYRQELVATIRRTAKILLSEHGLSLTPKTDLAAKIGNELKSVPANQYLYSPGPEDKPEQDLQKQRFATDVLGVLSQSRKLVNYSGYLCVEVRSGELPQVVVSLRRVPEGQFHEEIKVEDGVQADSAAFEVELLSDQFDFSPHAAVLKVEKGGDSAEAEFVAKAGGATEGQASAGTVVYVNLYQANRLLKTLSATMT